MNLLSILIFVLFQIIFSEMGGFVEKAALKSAHH